MKEKIKKERSIRRKEDGWEEGREKKLKKKKK